MTKITLLAAPAALALMLPATAFAQSGSRLPASYEEQLAVQEASMILASPIAGIDNNLWHDYQTDISEARQELRKDLDDVSDAEDRRDAFEEYRRELSDARMDYAKEMKEKGYRLREVRVHPY